MSEATKLPESDNYY